MSRRKTTRTVYKRPGEQPQVIELGKPDDDGSHYRTIRRLLDGGGIESIHGGPDGLTVFADTDGVRKQLPHNCNGLLGPVVLATVNARSGLENNMSDRDIERAMTWLNASVPVPGSALATNLAANPFADVTDGLLPVGEWVRRGHEFSPDLHFTGLLADPGLIGRVEKLLRKYGGQVVAYADQSHPGVVSFRDVFSVELQFADTPVGRRAAEACLAEYES